MLQNKTTIHLFVRRTTSRARRQEILCDWYRQQLRELIPPLLTKWSTKLGVKKPQWGVRKMKTKWGSCNADSRRIWLNLELAKKPIDCLEYIIVHELVHFLERHHNERFVQLMSKYLPAWRSYQNELKSSVLGDDQWNDRKNP